MFVIVNVGFQCMYFSLFQYYWELTSLCLFLRELFACFSTLIWCKFFLDQVKRLLDEGMDVNVPAWGPKSKGATPLHLAAEGGHLDVMDELLERGANIDARTKGACGCKLNSRLYQINQRDNHWCFEWLINYWKLWFSRCGVQAMISDIIALQPAFISLSNLSKSPPPRSWKFHLFANFDIVAPPYIASWIFDYWAKALCFWGSPILSSHHFAPLQTHPSTILKFSRMSVYQRASWNIMLQEQSCSFLYDKTDDGHLLSFVNSGTPLHSAAKERKREAVKFLIENGAFLPEDINDSRFNPPLHYCSGLEWAYEEMERLKLESSSSTEGSSSSGSRSPFWAPVRFLVWSFTHFAWSLKMNIHTEDPLIIFTSVFMRIIFVCVLFHLTADLSLRGPHVPLVIKRHRVQCVLANLKVVWCYRYKAVTVNHINSISNKYVDTRAFILICI